MAVDLIPMDGRREIECLDCGSTRLKAPAPRTDMGPCPNCGGVGWEYSTGLSELERSWYQRASLYLRDDEAVTAATPEQHVAER
jgi:hypothetical protein